MVTIDPNARIFLVNVGVNASDGSIRSPIFPDGTFEFLPIREDRKLWSPTLPAYPKLAAFNDPDETLGDYAPARVWNDRLHDDPEFRTFTYGDNPNLSPKAAGLRACGPGDYLFFYARLVPYRDGVFHGAPGFFLIGFFRVADVLRDVSVFPQGPDFMTFGANAHVRRAAYHSSALDRFWVWKGAPDASLRLPRAVPFDRRLAVATLRTAKGGPWEWAGGRTDLQVIGSYTRSARLVVDPTHHDGRGRVAVWWNAVAAVNPDVVVP